MKKRFGKIQAQKLLPRRRRDANKSHGGRSLIIAGSRGMFGAAVLSATACARMGSGYVTLATDTKGFPTVGHPDFLLNETAARGPLSLGFSAVGIGPGLGSAPASVSHTARLLKKLRAEKASAVVVDADALNASAKKKLAPFPSSWIVTPHEGELGRLLNVSPRVIQASREKYARLAQKKLGCIVLLKGPRTLIAAPGDRLFEIQSGNAALAKAGTGDVLTGLITALLAQGLSPVDAACLGAFVHGWLADEWSKTRDPLSMLATDLVAGLPSGLASLRRNSGLGS